MNTPNVQTNPASRYRGMIGFTPREFRGWTTGHRDATISMTVTGASGENVIWEGLCDEPRPNRKGNQACGFSFALSGRSLAAEPRIRFFETGTMTELPFSPFEVSADMREWIDDLNALSNWPFLHVSALVRKNDGSIHCKITLAGDHAPTDPLPISVETRSGHLTLDPGEILSNSKKRTTRTGEMKKNRTGFWHARSYPVNSHSLNLTRAFEDALTDETGTPYVRLHALSDGKARNIVDVKAVGLVPGGSVRMPPEANVRRVQAHGDIHQKFTLLAFLHYRTYREVFETYGDRPWPEIEAVLDWGCGCGRVTQQMMHNLGADRVFGADIDAGNVDWCLENLDSPNFALCQTEPPLPYADDTFDLIFATSVLTHIPEPLIGPWLADLNRVLKPGGIAALTAGTETRVAFGAYDRDRLAAWRARGIEDHVQNSQLDTSIEDKDYYRNVRMTKAYVREKWSEHLDVIEILDHAIGAQDIVVCRGR